ncbi:FHA domain-containing protein [bacterium]|nr:FHA domain-containing protein [bacterium]
MTYDPARAPTKLPQFVQQEASLSREQFTKNFNVPLLIQLTEPNVPAQKVSFGTMTSKKEDMIFGESGLYVFPLKKTATNAFAMMVTVGRATNNDIVLPYDSISKFHAYFSTVPGGGGWILVDANSMNGTFLEGRQLAGDAKEKLDLAAKPVIDLSFSKVVQCRLYTPEAFWDFARNLRDALKPPPRKTDRPTH